jgi:hypothetical protein
MIYTAEPRLVAERLDGQPAAGIVLFEEDGRLVVRRDGDEDESLLDELPDGHARAAAAVRNPNSGEVIVSAAGGWEFGDLAGRSHLGGGSHGSLDAADSEVPMLTVGLGPPPASITGIKRLVVDHFAARV